MCSSDLLQKTFKVNWIAVKGMDQRPQSVSSDTTSHEQMTFQLRSPSMIKLSSRTDKPTTSTPFNTAPITAGDAKSMCVCPYKDSVHCSALTQTRHHHVTHTDRAHGPPSHALKPRLSHSPEGGALLHTSTICCSSGKGEGPRQTVTDLSFDLNTQG